MNITTSITLNMQTPGYVVAYEPQGNKLSRFITATLKDGSASWSVPSGATAMIRVAKPDGTFAVYDKNEKGQTAYTISESTVTIELVGAALAAAGDALVTVMFLDSTGSNLSPFSFRLVIMPTAVSDDDIASSDYFNVFQDTINKLQAFYGAPLTAATASAMTDTTRVYVYVGSESGYVYGHWYYYNGSTWVNGGVYNSEGINSNWLYAAYPIETISNAVLANFSDGADDVPVKTLHIAINPVQNLHGYDHPWPGGGGKNLIPLTLSALKAKNTSGTWNENVYTTSSVSFTVKTIDGENVSSIVINGKNSTSSWVSFYITVSGLVSDTAYVLNGTPSGGTGTSYRQTLLTYGYDYGSSYSFTKNGSGNVTISVDIAANYTASNLEFKPMIRLASETDATFAPYTNPCPISGWTSAKIWRTGKNLLPFPYVGTVTNPGTYSFSGVTVTVNSDGTMLLNGTASANIYMNLTFDSITAVPVPPVGTLLTIGCEGLVAGITFINGIFTSPDLSTRRGFANLTDVRPIVSGLAIADGDYYFRSYIQINNGTVCNNVLIKPFFALGNTPDATFEQYKGEVYEVSFSSAGTVYGGTLTNNGDGTWTLIVDHYTMTVTGDDITATVNLGDVIRTNLVYVESGKKATGRNALAISNWLPRIAANYSENAMGFYFDTESRVYIKAPNNAIGITSETSVGDRLALTKAYFDANPLLIVYPLATALSFTLTGPEVLTLLGENNIWADCGEIEELAYRADIGLYLVEALNPIKEMLANREDGMKATRAYTAGDYIVVGDTFYRAAVSIANGATLTPGTNVIKTTVGDQLKALS